MQDGFLAIDDDGVAGVVAAGVADDDLRLLGEHVNDFAFAFVAPLGADENCICHKCCIFCTRGRAAPRCPDNKNPRTMIRGKAAGSLPEEARKIRAACQFWSDALMH